MRAETENPSSQCTVCVTPLVVTVVDCGTATWETQLVSVGMTSIAGWVLIEDNCEGGTPVFPTSDPGDFGSTDTTDCDCG